MTDTNDVPADDFAINPDGELVAAQVAPESDDFVDTLDPLTASLQAMAFHLNAVSDAVNAQAARQQQMVDSFNALGGNLSWLIDQLRPVLTLLNNPVLMGMISAQVGAMSGNSAPGLPPQMPQFPPMGG